MEKLLISACLLGIPCRYDSRSVEYDAISRLKEKYILIPVCPEIYGGLPTPRTPSERIGDRVMMRDGTDVTENYQRGAFAALKLCCDMGITRAVLKAKSPSCGKGKIYDGSFKGALTDGDGVTAELLKKNGIEVYTENEIDLIL